MPERSHPSLSRHLSRALLAFGGLSGAISLNLATPSLAHNVKIDGEVGATFHLEPDHNPKSGETSTVWFALTREGGETIPLADCDCELTVTNKQDESIEMDVPELTAIDVESYTSIPSAELVFPEPGVYALTIGGAASDTANEPFEAFELTYDVTVRPGSAGGAEAAEDSGDEDAEATTASADGEAGESEADDPALVDSWGWLIGSLVMLGVGALLIVFVVLRWIWNRIMKRLKKKSAVSPNAASDSASTRATSATETPPTPPSTPTPTPTPASTSTPTSAIAAEATPAAEVSEPAETNDTEGSSQSGDRNNPEDSISSIKDWD